MTTSTPKKFLCPINGIEMSNPVTNIKTGVRFEREAIMKWMKDGNNSCPITSEHILSTDFTLDKELQGEIEQWQHKRILCVRDRLLNRRYAMMEQANNKATKSSLIQANKRSRLPPNISKKYEAAVSA